MQTARGFGSTPQLLAAMFLAPFDLSLGSHVTLKALLKGENSAKVSGGERGQEEPVFVQKPAAELYNKGALSRKPLRAH